MTMKGGGSMLRRSISSINEGGGQKVCSVVQCDVLGSSIDEDMLYERTGQMGAEKYLRKSYYHRIECSVVNFLAVLMKK